MIRLRGCDAPSGKSEVEKTTPQRRRAVKLSQSDAQVNHLQHQKQDEEVPNHSTSDVRTTEYKGNAAFEGIKEFGLNRLAFRYRTDTERLAVLNEVYFPGWRAYIKETGKELPVMPVNLALRGIVVPAMPISGGGGHSVAPAFEGGEGEFSGAGASGSFEVDGVLADSGSSPVLDGALDSGGGIGDIVGDAAGEAVGAAFGDEGGCLVVVIVGIVAAMLAVIVGAGAYLVYEAPFILSEAAFEFILAASLLRGTRRMNSGDWLGSVFKTTSIPFLATLALAFLAGYLMHCYFPGVTRISELLTLL